MLAVLTGPVRSGKSSCALALALSTGGPVVIAVGGRPSDMEMKRRIDAHRAARAHSIEVMEVGPEAGWVAKIRPGVCLVVDCLGTMLAPLFEGLISRDALLADEVAEREAEAAAAAIVEALAGRRGDTVVVTNEVGWGVVPASPAGRLFRDLLGRANRELVARADAAWLVVDGRCLDLLGAPTEATWPTR